MARKYLNDIGVSDDFMDLAGDSRWEIWNKDIETYGFPEYETWALDFYFYIWLYERLKMYLEVNCVDLSYHKFTYKDGQDYTQGELIDKIIYGCELAILEECKHKKLTKDEENAVDDVRWMWATVMPAMWW